VLCHGVILVQDRFMSEEKGTEYWFNTATGQVEEGPQSSWANRLGPYGTREEAQRALEKARERSESWDREDEEWRRG
jgi:hypothetical protein